MQSFENKEKVCPKCENHCPPDQLKCPGGMKYFGADGSVNGEHQRFGGPPHNIDISSMPTDEAVIMLLRKCGHYLHHNAGHGGNIDAARLLSALSEDEKTELIMLLKKCSQGWQ